VRVESGLHFRITLSSLSCVAVLQLRKN